jgi:hypothetical protein
VPAWPVAWDADDIVWLDAPRGGDAGGGVIRSNGYSNLEHYLSGRAPNGTALP